MIAGLVIGFLLGLGVGWVYHRGRLRYEGIMYKALVKEHPEWDDKWRGSSGLT